MTPRPPRTSAERKGYPVRIVGGMQVEILRFVALKDAHPITERPA